MRRWMMSGAAALAMLVAGCGDQDEGNAIQPPAGGVKVAPVPPPQGSDWTQVIRETPEGGFVMGNPAAAVKLVEYGSFGCGHCAAFAAEATAPLQESYVKSGRVSWEFRPYLLFPTDPAIALLTRCHGPDAFFLLTEQLYASQPDWMAKMQAGQQSWQGLAPQARMKAMITGGGLDQFFRQRGMPQAKIDSCLGDEAALKRVMAVTEQGQALGVQGTPSFFINGQLAQGAANWAMLEPMLKRALGE